MHLFLCLLMVSITGVWPIYGLSTQTIMSQVRTSSDPELKKISDEGESFLRNITSKHTKVFSRDNLIANTVSPEENKEWRDLVHQIDTYITKDRVLVPIIQTLDRVSTDLLDALRDSYDIYLKPTLKDTRKSLSGNLEKLPVCVMTEQQLAGLETKIKKFVQTHKYPKTVANTLNTMQKKISTDIERLYKPSKVKKNNVADLYNATQKLYQIEVVQRLALTLDLTIEKMARDLEKIKLASKLCKH
jgi:hypothetical protein